MSINNQQQQSTSSSNDQTNQQPPIENLEEHEETQRISNGFRKRIQDSRDKSRIVGRVKWFNSKCGYGFITRLDTNEDIFVHYSAITMKNPHHIVKTLADGELVEFNVIATEVTGPNNQAVRGNPYVAYLQQRSDRYASGDGHFYFPFIPRQLSQTTGIFASRIPRWTGNNRNSMW